jgi:WD40 repeat protein
MPERTRLTCSLSHIDILRVNEMSHHSYKMPVTIFFCYAHEDEALLKRLQMHLKPLQRGKLVDVLWHDRDIGAGMEWQREIDSHLDTAQVILLLISPDFIASDYCYGIEMQRAIERHKRGEACVIPIILRSAYWQLLPVSELQLLPADAKPVISAAWHNQDEAFQNVAEEIHKVITKLMLPPPVTVPTSAASVPKPRQATLAARNSKFTLTRTLEGHSRLIRTVALSGDGHIVASGSDDETVRIWNTVNGRTLYTLGGHSGAMLSVSLSKDGQILASGGEDQTIKIWDVSTGALQHTLEGHTGVVYALALSEDGHILVSGSSDLTVRIWDIQRGSLLQTLQTPPPSFWVFTVAITADKQIAVSGRVNATIDIWDILTSRQLLSLRGHSRVVNSVAITPDGKTLVSGSDDQTVKMWDVASGRLLRTFKGHTNLVNAVAITSDGQMAISASHDHTIKVWDVASRTARQTLRGHVGRIFSVALSRDGQTLASGGEDETIKIWRKLTDVTPDNHL